MFFTGIARHDIIISYQFNIFLYERVNLNEHCKDKDTVKL
jgi:hypothetical protein